MNGFLVALRVESFVALRSLATRLLIAAPAGVVALQFLLVRLSEAGRSARDNLLGSDDFEAQVASNAYGHYVDGLSTGLTMLGLLLVAQAAYGFSYERDTGVVRHLLTRRISRRSLVCAKLLHLHLTALIAVLLLVASSSLLSGMLWEYGAIVEDGFELIGEAEIQAEIATGLRLALLPLPAAMAFGLLIAVLAQSATQAVTTALGITLALDVFKALLGDFGAYLYASYQPSLIDQSYLQDVGRIVRGYSDVLVEPRLIELNGWVPFPALLLFFALTLWAVQRKQI